MTSKVIFLAEEPILTKPQIKVVADIGIVAGQLTAGSLVLPFVIPGLDKERLLMIIWGLLFTFGFWIGSVLVVRRVEDE